MPLAGDHVRVKLDDSGGVLRTFDAGDIISVDIPLAFKQYDVTGLGDTAQKFISGQLQAPVTIRGYLTTTALVGTHTVLEGVFEGEKQVTLEVHVGLNAAPVSGNPMFTGEFYVESYKPSLASGAVIAFVATLKPAIGVGAGVPNWTTIP